MAKKQKKEPKRTWVPISEVERLEFIIQLNENSISDGDNVINDILEEQIVYLQIRLDELKRKEQQANL